MVIYRLRSFMTAVTGLFVASMVCAQVSVEVSGIHRFGPETSEAEACRLATDRAKRLAIERVVGETVRADRLLVCKEGSGDTSPAQRSGCRLSQTLWSALSGSLLDARVTQTTITPYLGGRACNVTLEAVVAKPNGEPDPDFDLQVTLDRPIYRIGEAIQLTVAPTQPGYLTVFNWAPLGQTTAPLIRLLPVDTGLPLAIAAKQVLPRDGTQLLIGGFPIDPGESSWIPPDTWAEYLIAVYTREPLQWPDQISLSDFGRKLHEIPRRDIRWQSHIFQVIQKPQLKKEVLQ